MKPLGLEQDPDYIALTRATHVATDGHSNQIARALGLLGPTAGRRIRALGLVDEPERITPAYRLHLLLCAAAECNPDREAALAPLYALMQLHGVGPTAADAPVGDDSVSLFTQLMQLNGRYGALLAAIEQAVADGRVAPDEVPPLLEAGRALPNAARRVVARLEKASRSQEHVK